MTKKIVQLINMNAEMGSVYRDHGAVMEKMIVVIFQMKKTAVVKGKLFNSSIV